jgi:hypothetical protein
MSEKENSQMPRVPTTYRSSVGIASPWQEIAYCNYDIVAPRKVSRSGGVESRLTMLCVHAKKARSKRYPPENAETQPNSVGGPADLLDHFLEIFSRHLENTFVRVEKNLHFYGQKLSRN